MNETSNTKRPQVNPNDLSEAEIRLAFKHRPHGVRRWTAEERKLVKRLRRGLAARKLPGYVPHPAHFDYPADVKQRREWQNFLIGKGLASSTTDAAMLCTPALRKPRGRSMMRVPYGCQVPMIDVKRGFLHQYTG